MYETERTTPQGKGLVITVVVLAAVFFSLVSLLTLFNRRDRVVGLKQDIKCDDFAFSVLAARRDQSLVTEPGDVANKRPDYYVVTMKIDNRAVRVDYTFRPEVALLVDETGREYRFSPAAQKALEEGTGSHKCPKPIRAGSSCVAELAFEMPAGSNVSHLRIAHSGTIGDLIDFLFVGNKCIDLRSAFN